MEEEKLRFIEEKKLAKTIEKEEAAKPAADLPSMKGVTNPIQANFLKFVSSKHKFNIKDL